MDSFNKIPPHGIVRNWLGTETIERLLSYARSNEYSFKESEVISDNIGDQDTVNRTKRISRRIGLGDYENEVRTKLERLLPVIFESLHVKPFMPTFELELVAHGNGAFFTLHRDTLRQHHRIISAVYYFHTLPKAFSGGVLRLHSLAASGEQGTFVDISPDYDTVVFFPSMFLHEVLPIKSPGGEFLHSRFAINCWLCRTAATPCR